MRQKLGDGIKQLRDDKNMSQNRFGEKIGVTGKAICAYESNRIVPPMRVLERIADVYRVNLIKTPKGKRKEIQKKLELIQKTTQELLDIMQTCIRF